jgi:hypothetical protein
LDVDPRRGINTAFEPMKKRAPIFLLLLLSVVVLLLWWRPRESSRASNATRQESQGAPAIARKSPIANGGISSDDLARVPWSRPDDYRRRVIATVRDAAQKANQPVEFYGRVVDQDANPIPAVRVKLSVRWTHELLPGTAKDEFNRFELTTDAEGLFTLTDTKGSLLSVAALEKEGYDPSPRAAQQSFWYWAATPDRKYTPDSHHPEIFRMWKKAGAERLVRKGIASPLRYDGTPTTLDLVTGSGGNIGDLRVTLVRNHQQIASSQHNYEWTLTMEALNGGLIESSDEQMYRAPDDGYQPKFVVHMLASDPKWAGQKSFNLYVKLRGNLYGRVEVKALVDSDRATTPFYVTSFINPSGSRNLEYSSLQDVVQPSPK